MRNSLLFLLIILAITLHTSEVTKADGLPVLWQKTFGGSNFDFGYSVQQISDGGFIIAGGTASFGDPNYDVYLIKTDPNGDLLWQKTFGGSDTELGISVQETADGGFVIAGITNSFGAGSLDVYLVKTDPNGNFLWQKAFGGIESEHGESVQQTSDGGYIITGSTSSFGASTLDVYLIKTDPNGNLLWQKTFGGKHWDYGHSVKETSDGGYIIAGGTESDAWDYGVYLVKTDSSGNLLWQKTFGGSSDDYGRSVQQTSDGGFIIAGGTKSFGAGDYDVYLIKTDSTGNLTWQKTFGGSDTDYGGSVRQTTDGGYIIAGWTEFVIAYIIQNDVYLIKTDSAGNSLWQKTLGGNSNDEGLSVQQTSDSGFIISGYTKSFGDPDGDVYLIKLCSENTLLSDLNCDSRVDFDDFVILANQWLQEPSIPSADIAPEIRDNFVDTLDLAAFVEYWLEGTTP